MNNTINTLVNGKTINKQKAKIGFFKGAILIFVVAVFSNIAIAQLASQQTNQTVPCCSKAHYYKNGKIKSCYLSKEYNVDGNIIPAGSEIFFYENGNPSEGRISKETKFYGQLLPANTGVFFNRWGHKFCFWLPVETKIQGHMIAATNDGIGNSLYENGRLKAIWLANDEIIDGVPCSSSGNIFRFGSKVMSLGTKRMVWFYDNGHLHQAMLSCDIKIQGYSFKKGDVISLNIEGKVDLTAQKIE